MKIARAISGFLLSSFFLMFFVCLVFGAQYCLNNISYAGADVSDFAQNAGAESLSNENLQVPALDVGAGSAISAEISLSGENKILFEKDIQNKLAIASLTKLMTAVVVLDNYNMQDIVTVDSVADSQSPIVQDIKTGDILPVEGLLDIMLIESSNKSAYALSEKMDEPQFVNLMNQKASKIGLQNTFYADPTGLSSQNVSTASDLIKLVSYILKNYPKISEITRLENFDVPQFGEISNTDELLGQVPDVVLSKTGFTDQAKGCLLLVVNNQKDNSHLIYVILGADDRFAEMKKLINWTNLKYDTANF